MTLRLRHLQLRAVTAKGVYGANVPFGPGLNVLWADNTKGKSMCMQGMLYALGLERMLSPRREVPLPHAMTTYLKTDTGEEIDVLESSLALEIENGHGQIIVVRRPIKSRFDQRLITVEFGPGLTKPDGVYDTKNFFVLDPGAAIREDGFHFFLEDYLGWRLPTVKRYDAPETKLYLETVFPIFWVEQKVGWSAIPAAIPTYLRIREVHKRAVEFIMDLDVHKLELQRQRLEDGVAANTREWRSQTDELDRVCRRNAAKIEGLPDRPTADVDLLSRARLLIAERGDWIGFDDLIMSLKARIAELSDSPEPINEIGSEELFARLGELSAAIDNLNSRRIQLANDAQLKKMDLSSLRRRITSLKEDLQKNQDVQKLQRYSGSIAELTPDHCPTCEQSLRDTLLSQEAMTVVMPIEDNIEYIRSQLSMFQDMFAHGENEMRENEIKAAAFNRELVDLYDQIRTIRADLVSPTSHPSAVLIEERLRLESRVRDLRSFQAEVDAAIDRLADICEGYAELEKQLAKLPKDKMSDADKAKMQAFTRLLRSQAMQYRFSTFNPDDLSLSEDSYRPQKEGFEIGFETSASDAIRLKWAYQIGLLELSAQTDSNHPGLLVLDEPRQQSSAKVSFEQLLNRAATSKGRDQQIIFSTSEDLPSLQKITATLDCYEIVFPGYVLQKLN
jgi:hypothetical protein